MKKLYTFIIGFALIFTSNLAKADEGMWIPALLTENYAEMERLGLKLTPEQLYDINNSSLKDAIVRLGSGFCTGEIISSNGLILTNHHCGFDAIQKLSTTTANHLENGFWAANHAAELPAGFSVSFLVKIEDITDRVLDGVTDDMNYGARYQVIRKNSASIQSELAQEEKYSVDIKEMYSGNKYYAYVYQVFKDVRLVGTPPKSVGKYGGDTDNWMWPRHTGDFSMFRVYADKDNNPAEYSEDNVPYQPKHHLPVSLKGVEQGDFAMIWGFPGSTDRYLSSYGVKLAIEKDQPARVKIRRAKLDLYEKYQQRDDKVNLMYASKHARVANYWKYFIGQTRGLKRLKVYEKKQAEEAAFVAWVEKGDDARKAKYGKVIEMYEQAYAQFDANQLAETYFMEAIYGTEFIAYGFRYNNLYDAMASLDSKNYAAGLDQQQVATYISIQKYASKNEEIKKAAFNELVASVESLKGSEFGSKAFAKAIAALEDDLMDSGKAALEGQVNHFVDVLSKSLDAAFKDYYAPIDLEVANAMFNFYVSDIAPNQRSEKFNAMLNDYNGNIAQMVNDIFNTSILVDRDRAADFLAKPTFKKLKNDLGVQLATSFLNFYRNTLYSMNAEANQLRATADRLYIAALFEMYPDKQFSPDANSSMRMTYGQVLNYSPGDAMLYKHFTTMSGVIEKYQPGDHEFDLPAGFVEKAKAKDFGRYAKAGEDLRICFLSNNDITGGNSGSPVISGEGHLIGLAFDGNWEAMSGDIAFETELQRTISVDIRYVLWCIDKLAGAGHIVDEMTLVTE